MSARPPKDLDHYFDNLREAASGGLQQLRGERVRSGLFKAAFALAVAVAVWWLVWLSIGATQRTNWSQNILVPFGIVAVACLVALRHERHWSRPVKTLMEILPGVREGKIPIEELSRVRGGIIEVIPQVQQMLHELKQQKLRVAELHEEIRLRVASRTDALERRIGTLRQQAVRDGLTGLYNRRMLDRFLPQLVEKCRAEGSDLCLMMIDVDNFKILNDTLGHPAGDELLRDVGQLIRSSVRGSDAAFRYGGDEFCILMPGASPDAAHALGERLGSLVDGLAKSLPRLSRRPGLSIGCAMLGSLDKPESQALLAQADRNLYEIKAARRMSHVKKGSDAFLTKAT